MRVQKKELQEIIKLRRALAYIEREFIKASLDAPQNSGRLENKAAEYARRAGSLRARIRRLEAWADSISAVNARGYDPADLAGIQDLVKARYIDGRAWKEIAASYYAPEIHDESYPRRKVEKFLKDISVK